MKILITNIAKSETPTFSEELRDYYCTEEIKIYDIIKSHGIKKAIRAFKTIQDKGIVMLFLADVTESVIPTINDKEEIKEAKCIVSKIREHAFGEYDKIIELSKDAALRAVKHGDSKVAFAWCAINAAVNNLTCATCGLAAEITGWKKIKEILLKYIK